MRVAVITSPFCALPPDAIGALERLWFDLCTLFAHGRHSVLLIGKRGKTILPDGENLCHMYVPGFSRTGNVVGDIFLDFFYSVRALWRVKKCEVLVVNTFWGPILAPILFRRRYAKLVYNVARFPKWHLTLYKGVDLFACTSKAVASALREIAPIYGERICVISNPVEMCRVNCDMGSDWHMVGYHGRIHEEKGLDILARAVADLAKIYPDLRIKMIGAWDVGKGGSGEAYKSRIDELSGGRVDWTGPVSDRKGLASELQQCDIYCYPSVAEKGETFGVAPLEAMQLGLPTIVSRLECFEDFVKDGENGLVFDHRAEDPVKELVVKMKMLFDDGALAKRLGIAASETAKKFSTEFIAEQWIAKFEDLLKE